MTEFEKLSLRYLNEILLGLNLLFAAKEKDESFVRKYSKVMHDNLTDLSQDTRFAIQD